MKKVIFEKIDNLNKEYIKVWEDVCNIESPTNFKEGVDKVSRYFADMAKKLGFKIEYSRQDNAGDVLCVTMNPDSNEKPVVLSGHIDTVHPLGMFGTPAVHFDDEKIYGPGVTDCKGGVVAAFYAMQALYECGFDKRPVKLILQTDEETSSKTSDGKTIKYICETSKDAVLFLNLETHTPGKATLSRKGIVSYRFDIEGKEGHSSRCVTEGANAVVDASYKIIELDKLKDADGITCNCAIVSGGTVVNTIPGKCTFSVNFRYATQEQFEWIENYIEELSSTEHVPGCKCTFTKLSERPAMELKDFNVKILEKANRIFAQNNMQTLEGRMLRGGSDASYITLYGIPCIDSFGTQGGGSHSINEYAKLDSLNDAAKRIALLTYYID